LVVGSIPTPGANVSYFYIFWYTPGMTINLIFLYIVQFIVSGGVVVGMSILASHANPKYAALLYAIPIQFILAAIFIYFGTKDGTVQNLVLHSLVYIIGLVVFMVAFYFMIRYTNFWLSLVVSLVIFTVISLIIFKFYQ
jgi:hypothetical protein